MRLSLALTLLFFVHSISAQQQQQGFAEYEMFSVPFVIDEDMPDMAKSMFERFGDDNGETFFYKLYFNSESSFGTNLFVKSEDEVQANPSYVNMFSSIEPGICFDRINNEISYNENWKDTTYLITEDFEKEAWEFTDSTATINGYECKEAILKHSFNSDKVIKRVWYCEDIPLSLGPKKYIGFPGLVVRAYGSGIELNLINLQFEDVDFECSLEGIPISGLDYTAKKEANAKKWLNSFKK